jgi:hypothetical protein
VYVETPLTGHTSVNTDPDAPPNSYKLEFPLPEKRAAQSLSSNERSLVNYEQAGADFMNDINYYQLIAVDAEDSGNIWAMASWAEAAGVTKRLSIVVMPDTTYHLLLLHGHKNIPTDPDETPVLLGSGYIKYKIKPETSNQITIRMVPVLIDMEFITTATDSSWTFTKNIAKTIAWAKEGDFNVNINLRSRSAVGDTAPHGNALWPLWLAEARDNPDAWERFYVEESPQYKTSENDSDNLRSWEGTYWTYVGEDGDRINLFEEREGSVTLYASRSDWQRYHNVLYHEYERGPGNLIDGKTNGSISYDNFPSLNDNGNGGSADTDYGKFSFSLSFVPFNIKGEGSDVIWQKAGGPRLAKAPKWKISSDVYLAYRLYARTHQINVDGIDVGGLAADAVSDREYSTGIPVGISWATASYDLQALFDMASDAYARDDKTTLKEIWVEGFAWWTDLVYTNVKGNGTVLNIDGKEGVALYGGFTSYAPPDEWQAELNSRPASRENSFHTWPKGLNPPGRPLLYPGNEYGTVTHTDYESILDAKGSDMAVKVKDAANIILDGFTIKNGRKSGLWIENAQDTTLFQNLTVTNNQIDTSVSNGDIGGGIHIDGGAPKLNYLTVRDNKATGSLGWGWGGGIGITSLKSACTAVITNALVSNNEATMSGGGIAIGIAAFGGYSLTPYLKNIILTNNLSIGNGSGIYNDGNPVIVNALVSGNTCDFSIVGNFGAQSVGGALYTTVGHLTIVNALISGNKSTVSKPSDTGHLYYYGGGGFKVDDGALTLVNSTVSGNYAAYSTDSNTDPLPGGGIMVVNMNGGVVVRAYNSLVLGNTGTSGDRNDVATERGGQFIAYNTLVGGYTAAQLNAGVDYGYGGGIMPGTANADGTAYGATAPNRLIYLGRFFEKFLDIPNNNNTGKGHEYEWVMGGWNLNFRLNRLGAIDAIDGGSSNIFTTVSGGIPEDLDGNARVQVAAPDMGAYESTFESVGADGGN